MSFKNRTGELWTNEYNEILLVVDSFVSEQCVELHSTVLLQKVRRLSLVNKTIIEENLHFFWNLLK
jgi:hypothetical protein